MQAFIQLPDPARVWVYQADRAFTAAETDVIQTSINNFISNWAAHKEKVAGEGHILYNRFVVLAADEEIVPVSGCSIDSTLHLIQQLGSQFQVNFFDRFYTCWLQDQQIKGASFENFRKLFENGMIDQETIVFNNTITKLSDLRNNWMVPLSKSWQKQVVFHKDAVRPL